MLKKPPVRPDIAIDQYIQLYPEEQIQDPPMALYNRRTPTVPTSVYKQEKILAAYKENLLWYLYVKEPQNLLLRQNLFTVYVHLPPGQYLPKTSIFSGREVEHRFKARYAQHSIIQAELAMLHEALKNPLNQKFILISEACAPLYPPELIYMQMLYEDKSRVNACNKTRDNGYQRWNWAMATNHLHRYSFRYSRQWFALTREHAKIVLYDKHIERKFNSECYTSPYNMGRRLQRFCVSDESYIPTVLSAYGLDYETTCHGNFAHSYWTNTDWSPKRYHPEDISITLFKHLRACYYLCKDDVHCKVGQAVVSASHYYFKYLEGHIEVDYNKPAKNVDQINYEQWVRHLHLSQAINSTHENLKNNSFGDQTSNNNRSDTKQLRKLKIMQAQNLQQSNDSRFQRSNNVNFDQNNSYNSQIYDSDLIQNTEQDQQAAKNINNYISQQQIQQDFQEVPFIHEENGSRLYDDKYINRHMNQIEQNLNDGRGYFNLYRNDVAGKSQSSSNNQIENQDFQVFETESQVLLKQFEEHLNTNYKDYLQDQIHQDQPPQSEYNQNQNTLSSNTNINNYIPNDQIPTAGSVSSSHLDKTNNNRNLKQTQLFKDKFDQIFGSKKEKDKDQKDKKKDDKSKVQQNVEIPHDVYKRFNVLPDNLQEQIHEYEIAKQIFFKHFEALDDRCPLFARKFEPETSGKLLGAYLDCSGGGTSVDCYKRRMDYKKEN